MRFFPSANGLTTLTPSASDIHIHLSPAERFSLFILLLVASLRRIEIMGAVFLFIQRLYMVNNL